MFISSSLPTPLLPFPPRDLRGSAVLLPIIKAIKKGKLVYKTYNPTRNFTATFKLPKK